MREAEIELGSSEDQFKVVCWQGSVSRTSVNIVGRMAFSPSGYQIDIIVD